MHGAKGREADYVVVLDLADDIYGFPCLREDDPLLGPRRAPGGRQPLSEPPRNDDLFYVGITRGKKATYLVADPHRPSPFIRELLQIAPEVRETGPAQPRLSLLQGRTLGAFPNRQQPEVHELSSVPTHGAALHGVQGRIRLGEPDLRNRSYGDALHQRRLPAQGAGVSQLQTRGAYPPVERQNQQQVLGVQRMAGWQWMRVHKGRRAP